MMTPVFSVTLDICAVQRRVLERLRELVVDSIHQVKRDDIRT